MPRTGPSIEELRAALLKPGATYATRLRLRRLEAGLTQGELSQYVGVTRSSITRWEGGGHRPTVTAARKLARVLGDRELEFMVVVRGTDQQRALDEMRAAGVDFNRMEQYGIGTQVRYHRCRHGYTLAALAKAAGVTEAFLLRVEKGAVKLPQKRTLRALDAVLDTEFFEWRSRQKAQTCRATRSVKSLPFPDWFSYHRKHAGLTREELGDQAGVCWQVVRRIERGDGMPKPASIQWLAEALPADTEETLRRFRVYSASRWCPPHPLTFNEALAYRRRLFWLSASLFEEDAELPRGHWSAIESGRRMLTQRHVPVVAERLRVSERGLRAWAVAHQTVVVGLRQALREGGNVSGYHPRLVAYERGRLGL